MRRRAGRAQHVFVSSLQCIERSLGRGRSASCFLTSVGALPAVGISGGHQ